MRSIMVSTDVFARIWSLRAEEEDTEDEILRRVLDRPPSPQEKSEPAIGAPTGNGFYDARHRVFFPEGFEVFRTYIGTKYRARASRGSWVLEGSGRGFRSLNELSRAIGAKTENAWINWFFLNDLGQRRPVSDLREPSTVASRARDTEEEMVKMEPGEYAKSEAADQHNKSAGTWRDDVYTALNHLGGRASLHRIYKEVKAIRKTARRSLPISLEAIVRRELENASSDSESYLGGTDIFCMPEGKGAGVWALR